MLRKLRFWLRNIVGLSRTETNGAIGIIVILFFCIAVPIIVPHFFRSGYSTFESDKILLDSIVAQSEQEKILPSEEKPPALDRQLFTFDPNTSSENELAKLGIPSAIVRRIINYREKGGKFYIKNDLMKIYDFPREIFNDLYAYIDLPEIREQQRLQPSPVPPVAERKAPVLEKFNINEADTNQLKLIRGIGSSFSKRIINYRTSLGGFVSTDQLQEVYGLQDEALENILALATVSEDFIPHKIKINQATAKELASHPYINFKLANRLIAYRDQHGSFKDTASLAEIREIDKEAIQKIQAYLDFD